MALGQGTLLPSFYESRWQGPEIRSQLAVLGDVSTAMPTSG